jgi:hypothetical protein
LARIASLWLSPSAAWIKKGSGTVVRSTLRAVPATVPDPFLNHAPSADAAQRLSGWLRVLMPLLLVAGCASWYRPLPMPPEVTQDGVAARVLIPTDLNVQPLESVVKPGTPGQASSAPSASQRLEPEPTTFGAGPFLGVRAGLRF